MVNRGAQIKGLTINKPVVFIGLMGAGKSRIGKDRFNDTSEWAAVVYHGGGMAPALEGVLLGTNAP